MVSYADTSHGEIYIAVGHGYIRMKMSTGASLTGRDGGEGGKGRSGAIDHESAGRESPTGVRRRKRRSIEILSTTQYAYSTYMLFSYI